jgi:glycine oxidase
MAALAARLAGFDNVTLRYGAAAKQARADWTIDCRGLAAQDALPDLRGVKGEMLVLYTREIALRRPVRLLHPRHPAYIVPRGDGRFMIGATMIENEEAGRITARAMLELLGAAYCLHPAFAEAEIVETGAGVRPAFPDNLPRLQWQAFRSRLKPRAGDHRSSAMPKSNSCCATIPSPSSRLRVSPSKTFAW